MRAGIAIRALGVGLCLNAPLFAEDESGIGRGPDGLTALASVPAVVPAKAGLALSCQAGYGFTEAQVGESGSHHRLLGGLAVAYQFTPELAASLALDGRYDAHPADEQGVDTGLVGTPRLVLRGLLPSKSSVGFGAQLQAWFPGQEAPSVDFSATTLDLRLLAGSQEKSGLNWSGQLGFRLDQSSQAAPDASRLRQGDRIALGLSDYHAAIVGLGLSYRSGATEYLAAAHAALLLGAPSLTESPMGINVGIRQHLSPHLQLQGMLQSNLSSRPGIGPTDPLIPLEPLIQGVLGLRVSFGDPPAPKTKAVTPEETKAVVAPPQEVVATHAAVSGVVTDEQGAGLAQVEVTVRAGAEELVTTTQNDGSYRFPRVPVGPAQVGAQTADFQPTSVDVTVPKDGQDLTVSQLRLQPVVLHTQLQGLVRSFSGTPLQAAVKIEPGPELVTGPDGRFQVDIEPGTYTVRISADGYLPQTKKVSVTEKAVIVINADLRKNRK